MKIEVKLSEAKVETGRGTWTTQTKIDCYWGDKIVTYQNYTASISLALNKMVDEFGIDPETEVIVKRDTTVVFYPHKLKYWLDPTKKRKEMEQQGQDGV